MKRERALSTRTFNAWTRVAAVVLALSAIPVALVAAGATSATGLRIYQINGRAYGVRTAVHVVTFQPGTYSLQVGLAAKSVDGGIQTPSTMCRNTPDCVAAVNGDFFTGTTSSKTSLGDNVGGIIQDCVLLHTPQITHQQVNLDTQTVSQGLNWSASINVNDTSVAITAINRERPLTYNGSRLPLNGVVLFTAPYVPKTPAPEGRMTYEFAQVPNSSVSTAPVTTTTSTTTTSPPTSTTTTTIPTSSTTTTTTTLLPPPQTAPTTINTSTSLTLIGETIDPAEVAPGDVDVSATFHTALSSLHLGQTVTLTTSSTAGCDSIGGHPILINQGAVQSMSGTDGLLFRQYARTVVGWTSSGDTIIMTVNGKDGVSGATVPQLDRLLRSLGVVTAINLDGGGSTALYANGQTYSLSGTERPVATALLVVQNPLSGS
jgi:exopolysaccharide biosynthesis protein